MSLRHRLRREFKKTIARPGRLRRLLERGQLGRFLASFATEDPKSRDAPWEDEDDGFIRRRYEDYRGYVEHQQSKFASLDLSDYDVRYRRLLTERLRSADHVGSRSRVLCLAARIGTEVKAFHDLDCFAVGIDLNPGEENRYVLRGDFHDVQFPNGSVDVVFTNSLDHALEPKRVLAEVRRLLAADGLFVAEIPLGMDEGFHPREYETFFWRTLNDAVAFIESEGFTRVSTVPFAEPWPGQHITFRPSNT